MKRWMLQSTADGREIGVYRADDPLEAVAAACRAGACGYSEGVVATELRPDWVRIRNRLGRLMVSGRISLNGYQRGLQRTWSRMSDADKAREFEQLWVLEAPEP